MSERAKNILAFTLLGLGAAAVLLGFLRGEAAEVMKKATMICLECIGIG